MQSYCLFSPILSSLPPSSPPFLSLSFLLPSLRIPAVQTLHPLDTFYKAKQSVKVFMKMSASMTPEKQTTVSYIEHPSAAVIHIFQGGYSARFTALRRVFKGARRALYPSKIAEREDWPFTPSTVNTNVVVPGY